MDLFYLCYIEVQPMPQGINYTGTGINAQSRWRAYELSPGIIYFLPFGGVIHWAMALASLTKASSPSRL